MESANNRFCWHEVGRTKSASVALSIIILTVLCLSVFMPKNTSSSAYPHRRQLEQVKPLAANATPLLPESTPFSLGLIRFGASIETPMAFHNPTSTDFVLSRVVTSCPCISIKSLPYRIKAGESGVLMVAYDATIDVGFHGTLSVEVTGYSSSDRKLLYNHISLTVEQPRPVEPQ